VSDFGYTNNAIGNRLTANENSAVTNYTSNLLNQENGRKWCHSMEQYINQAFMI